MPLFLNKKITVLLVVVMVFFPNILIAQTMTSTTYQLQFDSANSGGGLATSTSYQIEDTVGEIATGRSGSTPANWFDTDWLYRTKITVNADRVTSTLSNFPLYVDLSHLPASFFANIKSDGSDIRVAEGDGMTETPFEVASIDKVAGTGELYVMIDSLSSAVDTDFYVYYGNSAATFYSATSTYGSENVWNADYVLVSHHTDETSASVLDSTSNGFDGTKASADNPLETTTGKIGEAQEFIAGGANEITHGNFGAITSFTVSAWINADTTTGSGDYNTYGYTVFASSLNGTARYPLWLTLRQGDIRLWAFEDNPTTGYRATTDLDLQNNQWYHLVVTAISGGTTRVLLNNQEVLSFVNDADVGWSTIFTIGDLRAGRSINFDGEIDEVRFSSSVRSDDWIATEYFNQQYPRVLYTVHEEESRYGTYVLNAGYQQMNETFLSISLVNDVILEPGVGIIANNSVASELLRVRSDNPAGYNLYVKTTQSPALQKIGGGNNFSDYTPTTPAMPEIWSVDSGQSQFGYSLYDLAGGDVSDGDWGTADDCGNTTTGDPDGPGGAEQLYDALTTSNRMVAQRTERTSETGSDIVFCFAAGTNDGLVEFGAYQAPIVVTAIAL